MPDPHLYIPETRLAVIDGEVWDMGIEEPLTSTDAYEALLAELTSDELEDELFVELVLAGVIHHVMGADVDEA
jgi:hypothetical protein|tara:strand:+ start:57 stop:275 length:219 start_codon:yes stop_codon:yes gene_type:complete